VQPSTEGTAPATVDQPATADQRILSVDALRGFDMFWIVGGGGFVASILAFCPPAFRDALLPQLEHVDWDGFHFCDLIFPLFLFVVGMTTVFSLTKTVARHGRASAYRRIIPRFIILFLLGVFYSNGLADGWPNVRLLGVLQRIAICYLITSILFMHFRVRGLVIITAILLVGYWAWLSFVPVPDLGVCSFAPGKNWSNYLDARFLPGRKYDGAWDPEGYLSTLPAIGTCVLGVLAGLFLQNQKVSSWAKVGGLIGAGLLMLVLGYAWGMQFPIVKKIWTSSFVLVAAGYSCVLLGVFYAVIDVWKLWRWSTPFLWIGSNAIAIYMIRNVVDFDGLAHRIIGPDIQNAVGKPIGHLLLMTVSLGMVLALTRFLYRNKVFIRV
jgi:predicted acyltransferase